MRFAIGRVVTVSVADFALPEGYVVHGDTNPPVSCSTHQAALFGLTGKLAAVQRSLEQKVAFVGDVHIEPHHGVNMTGDSLEGLATLVLENLGFPPVG